MLDLFSQEPSFAAPPIQIYVGTTFIKFRVSKNGRIGPMLNLAGFVKNHLQEREWVPRFKTYITTARYTLYDEKTGMAILPRYALASLLKYLGGHPIEFINVEPVTPRKIKLDIKKRMAPKEHQLSLVNFLSDENTNYKPLSAGCGAGKLLSNTTPIRVPGGWKPIGEMQLGDLVMSQDGSYTSVIGVYPQGKKQLYRITFVDGRHIDAGAEHLWKVFVRDWTNHWQTLSTMDMIRLLNKTLYIPLCEREQVDDIPLPVHPYLLGTLIGDGTLGLQSIGFTTDIEIIDKLRPLLPPNTEFGTLRKRSDTCDYCYVANLHRIDRKNKDTLSTRLKELGLLGTRAWEKSIPEEYMEASPRQKLALIQGLLDTDGYSSPPGIGRNGKPGSSGSIEFSTTSKKLAEQFQLIVRSLGAQCRMKEKQPYFTYKGERYPGRLAYIVRIRAKNPGEFFTLSRKRANFPEDGTNQYSDKLKLKVVSIEPLLEKEECTCIAVAHPSKLYVAKDYIVTHNTACAIFSICHLKLATLIVLGGLINQWYKSIRQFSNIKSEDIYVVQGFEALKKLWEAGQKGYKPKIIIFSTRTLQMYALDPKSHYAELPSYAQFQVFFGIGIKIFDEVHLGFMTNTQIDLVSNIRHNFYLSATYRRSSPQGKRIFNTVFPKELIFGEELAVKYAHAHMVQYRLGISQNEAMRVKTNKGYNHGLYEALLLKHRRYCETFVDQVLVPLVDMYYVNVKKDGQRLLILCWTRKMAEFVTERLKRQYPRLKVTIYLSGTPGKSGRDSNLSMDVIVSTQKSCGTGRDIKELKTCINTISFGSSPLAEQVLGRLRRLPDDDVIFVDMWNGEIQSHYNHHLDRLEVYKVKALTVQESSL